MGLMLLKKLSILFLLISASLLSTSLAAFSGRKSKFLGESGIEEDATYEDEQGGEATTTVHERLLRVNTRDYGRYNPSPQLVRPPFKMIPN